MTRVTSGSNGMPPSPFHQATRAPRKSRPSGAAKRAPSSLIARGLLESFPLACTLNSSATSATERAMGPETESGLHVVAPVYTRPGDGRKPTTLQKAAGFRRLPPVSLPSAMGTIPVASATAAPPLLPPHVLPVSYGFFVAPKIVLNVCDPAPNSGVFVLPNVTAPAARMRWMIGASLVGTKSR